MGDQKGKSKKAKSTKVSKAEKAKLKRAAIDSIRSGKGAKKVINPKRHKGSHIKGTRKGN